MIIQRISRIVLVGVILYAITTSGLTSDTCSFSVPEYWNQANTRWDGACLSGHAEGRGILREFSGQKVKRFFFGSIKNGDIEQGVIEQDEGYIAGRFDKGRLVPSEDRQSFINAFTEAEKATLQMANQFKKAGNKELARLCEAKAKKLHMQME